MICINCGFEETNLFYVEQIKCSCGDYVTLEFFSCSNCNSIWKTVNGEVDSDTLLSIESLILPDMIIKGFVGFLEDNFSKEELETLHLMSREYSDDEVKDINSYAKKCDICKSLCIKDDMGNFKCTSCGNITS